MPNRPKIYLDYAATTPVDKEALKAMLPYFSDKFGNSSSLHNIGREAKEALENSRKLIAKYVNSGEDEIFFTSSDTESNNTALKGIALANRNKGNHIIISSVEHDSVLEIASYLESQGFKITKIPVDKIGIIDLGAFKDSIKKETILVSVIFASNEIGTIQPIKEIGKICKEKGIYFHTDASQAFGRVSINVRDMNIDLLSASSHKIYGPKGVAILYVKRGVVIEPLLHGGGQEKGFRSSSVNVPAIIGFAKAIEISMKNMAKDKAKSEKLADILINGVLEIEGSYVNGPKDSDKKLPHIINFWFEGIEGELLVENLNNKGFYCSTGSACSSVHLENSHILKAIGLTEEEANGSLRVSLGRQTTEKDIKDFVKVLKEVVEKMRKINKK